MAVVPKGISCGKTKKRRDEVCHLSQNVRDSCEVMVDWIKESYDEDKAINHLKEIADLFGRYFSKFALKVQSEALRLVDKTIKEKLTKIGDSFKRHEEELKTAVTNIGSAKDEILISVEAGMVEIRLVEKHTRNIERSVVLIQYFIKSMKDIIKSLGPCEKDVEKLQKEREESEDKRGELTTDESDDEKTEDPKKKSKKKKEDSDSDGKHDSEKDEKDDKKDDKKHDKKDDKKDDEKDDEKDDKHKKDKKNE